MTKKLLLIIPAILILSAGALYVFANSRVKSVVDTRMAEMIENGEYLALEYDTVGIELNGDIVMNNLHVTDNNSNEYTLVDIRLSDYDYFSSVPEHLSLSTSGIRFPGDLPVFGNSAANPLNSYLGSLMADETLALEITYRFDYQQENQSSLQNFFKVNLPGSFTLTSDWEMKNVPMESLKQSPGADIANTPLISTMIQNADIPRASITLQDLGMVNVMMSMQGDALGLNGEEYRQQLLLQMQTAALFVPQQLQTLAQDFLGSFTLFLEGEKTFQLSITPEYDGNIQRLQGEIMGAFYIGNISRITELLNLNIETL